MRFILDSHILIAIALKRLDAVSPTIGQTITRPDTNLWASVASLWEITIKTRLGKLDPGMPVEKLSSFFEAVEIEILPITAVHAVTSVEPVPPTRDPFDRMLLAQCLAEDCRLVTLDHALRDHPLAARFQGPTRRKPTARNPKTRP